MLLIAGFKLINIGPNNKPLSHHYMHIINYCWLLFCRVVFITSNIPYKGFELLRFKHLSAIKMYVLQKGKDIDTVASEFQNHWIMTPNGRTVTVADSIIGIHVCGKLFIIQSD